MNSDVRNKGHKTRKKMIRAFDHQMHVQRNCGDLAYRLNYGRAKRNVVYEMTIHDIEMQPVTSGSLGPADLHAKLQEVGGQNGWCNDNWFALHRIFLAYTP